MRSSTKPRQQACCGCQTVLAPKGYGLAVSDLTEESVRQLKAELTAKPHIPKGYRPSNMPPTEFPLYQEDGGFLYVPKSYGLAKFGVPSQDCLPPGDTICVGFDGELRPEQREPVDCFLRAARDPSRRGGVLNLPCAFGKTAIAIYCICQLGKRAIVIVHKEFLVQQWRERLQQFAPTARVGLLQGDRVEVEGKDVVIAMLQSLSMRDYPQELLSGFGFVVVDEIHRTGAEVFSRALKRVNFQHSLGLSATLQRKDGMSKVFLWHIGEVVFKASTRGDDDGGSCPRGLAPWVRTVGFASSDAEYCKEHFLPSGKPNLARMINAICDFAPRTRMIVAEVRALLAAEASRKVLVLSDRRAHLAALEQALHACGLRDVGYYCGGMKQGDLKASEAKAIILGTFQMSQEGLDIRGLDTLVLASPKTDVVQAVGRILRDKPSERRNAPLVIDVVDAFGPFGDQAVRRARFYRSCGYRIESDPVSRSHVVHCVEDEAEAGRQAGSMFLDM